LIGGPRGIGRQIRSCPRKLTLHERHVAAAARFAPFAGWEMPLQYQGIVSEHKEVRARAGVFDISHLGRVELNVLPEAGELLRSVTTFNVLTIPPGTAHYSLYCNDDGGIADDIMIYRITDDRWYIVHDASNWGVGDCPSSEGCIRPGDRCRGGYCHAGGPGPKRSDYVSTRGW